MRHSSSSVAEIKHMVCPQCGHDRLHRAVRASFWENRIYSLFGLYPWECANCRQRYLRKKRYESRRAAQYAHR